MLILDASYAATERLSMDCFNAAAPRKLNSRKHKKQSAVS